MHYDLKKPCNNCPFLKKGGIPLKPGRIREISRMMLGGGQGDFACHKTTETDAEGETCVVSTSKHCAGALAYAEKHGTATQMMRIVERLDMYDPTPLTEYFDKVWDDEAEWLENGSC